MSRSGTMTKTMEETNQYKKGLWTEEEDKILKDYISVHGEGQWNHIAKKTGLKRCGKSCRSRWMNYLSPNVKRGNFTEDEEDLIIRLHNLLGNRWTLIAKRVPGRTDSQVKNYWNTHLSKKLAAHRKSERQSNKGRSSTADMTSLTRSRHVKLCKTGTSTDLRLSGNGCLISETTTVEGNQKTAMVSESGDSDPRESMVTDSYVDCLWITDDALELSAIANQHGIPRRVFF